MYTLQTSVVINDKEFHITNDGDFRMVLDCFNALNDEEMSEDMRVLASLLIFYNEFNSLDDLMDYQDILNDLAKAMYKFFNCGQDKSPGAETNYALIDWDKDAHMVCSAVNTVANKEIRAIEYVHWWTFMGYYMSVGDSVLATVVGIRHKIMAHKKLEKWEKEYKRDNPGYFVWKSTTLKDREQENLIRELWNNGGK